MIQVRFFKMKNYFKNLKNNKYLIFFSLLLTKAYVMYAAPGASPPPPSLHGLKDILSRIVGLFLAASAAALVVMIGYGIIKGSLAAGDPRGLEGAKSTWTYAVYGFLVVMLSILIVTIIRGRLGITEGSVGFGVFFDSLLDAVDSLTNIAHSNSNGGY